MTDYHPLTEELLALVDHDGWSVHTDEVDAIVRKRLDPEPVSVESGVRFTGLEDYTVEVNGTFIESGNQMQMAIIGTEPVLLVQPNFDADRNHVTLLVTAVDLPPQGLVEVLAVLTDGAKMVVDQQAEMALAED